MATLSSVLAQIRQNESGGNYTAQNPTSTASGAYQFVNGTWQSLTTQSGIGTQYATAKAAPANVQDAVAAYALEQNPNANSSSLWGGGPNSYPIVDSYDVSSQSLLSGSGTQFAGSGNNSASEGYGSVASGDPLYYQGTDPANGLPATSTNPGDLNNPQPVYSGSTSTSGGTTTTVSPSGTSSYSTAPAGTDVGYAPPASTGGPQYTGLAAGTVSSIGGWVNSVESAVGTAFKNAWDATIGQIENLALRFFVVMAAIVIIAIALWRLMDPDMSKTKGLMEAAA